MRARTSERISRPGRIDIWLTAPSLIGEEQQHAYRRLLTDVELAKLQTFVVPGARLQYLVARALLRTALSDYARVSAEAWEFETNYYGKPYIREPSSFRRIQFNLSHTDGLVACAVTQECSIGIDVENVDRKIDITALAVDRFAAEEKLSLQRCPLEQRRDRFFSYWTLKEAYVKARGIGLSLPLDGFWFDVEEVVPRVHFTEKCPDNPQRWQFRQCQPTSIHRLAVATADAGNNIDIRVGWTIPLVGQVTQNMGLCRKTSTVSVRRKAPR